MSGFGCEEMRLAHTSFAMLHLRLPQVVISLKVHRMIEAAIMDKSTEKP